MTTNLANADQSESRETPAEADLVVALPEPNLSLSQDAEWCVVEIDGEWRQVRFHDYATIFKIPGLYEKVIYEILDCDSPATLRRLLEAELQQERFRAENLRVLDLGAGNGMVAEELASLGSKTFVGVDIIEEARMATERDRPGLYKEYFVLDMSDMSDAQREKLEGYRFNCMSCVAALGFGDIPTEAFVPAFNLVAPGGWIVFNIKEDFLDDKEDTGFSKLIRDMMERDILEIRRKRRYQHRLSTCGDPLYYVGIVGRKNDHYPMP